MENKIKTKKIIWRVLLIIAILPFIITICVGIWHSIFGMHDSFCILCGNELIYGLEAFNNVVILATYLFWPMYIISIIVIILSIIRLVIQKRNVNK